MRDLALAKTFGQTPADEQTTQSGTQPSSYPSPEEVELLHEMCNVYSPSGSEGEFSAYLVEKMKGFGWQAYRDTVGNAIGKVGAGKKTILFLGHIDTVPGFIPVRLEDDRLFGRGAVDAKGPLAAFISAVLRCQPVDKRIIIVGAVDEEGESKGAYYVLDKYSPDFCIVGEPSGWSGLTLGYKGRLVLDAVVNRPVSHSAGPWSSAGEEAVAFWNNTVAVCQQLTQGKTPFETLIPSLRWFECQNNGFAEEALLHIVFRLPPACDEAAVRSALAAFSPGVRLSFSGFQPAFKAPKNNPLIQTFLAAIREEGGQPKFKVKTGTSDMNVVGPVWGCPIVAYGPGDSTLDHTPHEHISITEYGKSIAVLARVLQEI